MMNLKKIFGLLLLLSVYNSFGQFTLSNVATGTNVNDGDIITVSSNNFTNYFSVTNTHTSDIYLSAEVLGFANTDGSEVLWCFGVNGHGQCYFGMTQGDIKQGGAALAPGASTAHDDIDIKHSDNGSQVYPKDYRLKIEAKDASNNILSSITFTYRYDPTAAIDDLFAKSNFGVYASDKQLVVNTKQAVDITIYNLSGQEIKSAKLDKGTQYIDLNNLPAGVYMVLAQNGSNHIYKKIILQ